MAVIKAKSVSEEIAKSRRNTNKYIKQYGEMLWLCALLTAYQGGGYKELKYNYSKVPIKFVNLLLEAYKYKNTELELLISQASSVPHMKAKDSKKYYENIVSKLEGRD